MAASRPRLDLVANARMPSQRAQSLQVAQMAAAFERAGARVRLLFARRRDTPALPAGQDLWSWYGTGDGPRPVAQAVPCFDFIDRVPRRAQFVPARLQELSFAAAAAREVERGGAELCLVRELETAWALTRRGRRGVFLELHRMPGGRMRRRLLRRALPLVDGLIAISGGIREDLVALGADSARIIVAHDGFERARFASLPSRAEARAALGLDPERVLVVYTGGLLAWKGVEVLVDAARRLPRLQFVIAGGMDADVARIRALAEGLENVRIDGFQAPERVPLYLAAGDLGVVPNRSTPAISARYTSPLKVFEAMACGLPLVASDLPSLREILSEKEAVFVAADDADSLAGGLRELAEDTAGRTRRAERMRARAAENDWDARATRLFDWMKERAA